MLAAARDKDDYRIHLTYPVEENGVAALEGLEGKDFEEILGVRYRQSASHRS